MNTKSCMIAICGRPNVGKSTLTNTIVGEKVAIVSNKPQTTRNRICGIVNRGDTQLVFLDTPGFHKPRTKLGDYMVQVVEQSVADVDLALLLVEPIDNVGPQEQALIERFGQSGVPAILVINKIDTVQDKEQLLSVIAAYSAAFDFEAVKVSTKEDFDREFAKAVKSGKHYMIECDIETEDLVSPMIPGGAKSDEFLLD